MASKDWIGKSHDSWSVFKIMGELVEGYEKLSQLGPCVSIFGSARTQPNDMYYKKTIEISKSIVEYGLSNFVSQFQYFFISSIVTLYSFAQDESGL